MFQFRSPTSKKRKYTNKHNFQPFQFLQRNNEKKNLTIMLCYGERSKIIIVKAQLTHCPPEQRYTRTTHYKISERKKERRKDENVIDIESKIQSFKRPYTNEQKTKILDQLRSNMRTQRWQTLTSFSNQTRISTQYNWPTFSQNQPFQNMPRKKKV